MLWGAPIWLNEIIVTIMKFVVGVLIVICFSAPIALAYCIIRKIRDKRRFFSAIKDRDILVMSGALMAACIGLLLFYLPQPVLHDNISFNEISVQKYGTLSESKRIVLKDEEALDEFRELFSGQRCRRSFDSGSTLIDTDTVFIDLVAFEDDKRAFPLHFIVAGDRIRRYNAGNTDFIYVVEDKEKLLPEKIFKYIKIHAEDKNEISIKIDDIDIDYFLTAEPFRTGEDFEKACMYIEGSELIYVPHGYQIEMNLGDWEEIAGIKVYWINDKGRPNYRNANGGPLSMEIEANKREDKKYVFTVERLLQAALSSHYEVNEKMTAGYVVELIKGDETQYCYFMIRTDKNLRNR